MFQVAFYLLSILAANLLVHYFGIVHFAGLMFPAGAVAVGLTFSARDMVQQRYGKYQCWWFMGAASAITLAFNAKLALASVTAFVVSEAVDWAVYTFTKRNVRERMFLSNLIGTPLDSIIFVLMAFGPVWPAMYGQTIVKFASSLLVLPFINPRRVALAVVALLVMAPSAKAANVQLHYDFDRETETATVESLTLGKVTTFFFFDVDYNDGTESIYGEGYASYGEKWHIDAGFNGGVHRSFPLGEWALIGGGYGPLTAYARIDKDGNVDPQFTYIFYVRHKSLELSGFADYWRQDGEWIFLAEPQAWWNITDHIAIGSEIEVSDNFAGSDSFEIRPTIAVRFKH